MRSTVLRFVSAVGLAVSVVTLLISLWRAGFFDNIFFSWNDAFLISSVILAVVSLVLGVFSKSLSAFLRGGIGNPQVIVSGGNLEYDEVVSIIERLNERGILAWNDISDLLPGDDFFAATKNRIEESDALVVRWDKENELYLNDIVDHAIKKGVRVIPVLKLGEDHNLPPSMLALSGIYFSEDDLDYSIERIEKAVRASKRLIASSGE